MKKFIVQVVAACFVMMGGALASTLYVTTLLQDPMAGPAVDGIDKVVVSFRSDKTTGTITGADLIDYQISFFSGGSFIYGDQIITGGVGQSIGGAARDASSVFFRFDADALSLSEFNHGGLSGAVAGLIYLASDNLTLQADGMVVIQKLIDGVQQGLSFTAPWSQSTVVPLPPAAVLFAGPLLFAAARRRKKTR